MPFWTCENLILFLLPGLKPVNGLFVSYRVSFKFLPLIIQVLFVGLGLKNLPVMQEAWIQSLRQEDPLEKEMAAHSSILA